MGIGASIFLLGLGAVLTFAVDWKVAGLDLHAIGWILMAAGTVGLVLFFYFWNRRRVPAAAAPQMRAAPGPYHDITPVAQPAPVVAPAPVPAPIQRVD